MFPGSRPTIGKSRNASRPSYLPKKQVVKDKPLAPLSRRCVMSAPPSVQERVDW
jgi:hypothetical protein